MRLLRWHGAKSTLTSVMMHLNEGERAVRFSGNWKDQKESMPDCYLREAQLLVLGAQEKALWFIRDGGVIGKLEGVPLEPGPDHFETDEAATEFREIKTRAKRALEDFKPPVGISRNDVPQAVLDDLVRHGEASTEILASEKSNENFEISSMADLVVAAEDSLKDVFSPELERRKWRVTATPWWSSMRRSLSRSRAASEEVFTRPRPTRVVGQGATWPDPSSRW